MLKLYNPTAQVVPIIVPTKDGGKELRIAPHQTIVIAIELPTEQIASLIGKGKLRQRK